MGGLFVTLYYRASFIPRPMIIISSEIGMGRTPSFQVRKNFEKRQKHQRRRSAWMEQADFGKLELNNRNRSGNCQRLS